MDISLKTQTLCTQYIRMVTIFIVYIKLNAKTPCGCLVKDVGIIPFHLFFLDGKMHLSNFCINKNIFLILHLNQNIRKNKNAYFKDDLNTINISSFIFQPSITHYSI